MSVKLGHFELIDQIGRGGMGTVFSAFDTSLQRHVAIKLLDEDRATDGTFVEDFIREAQNAAAINHPHIVQIHFAGESDGSYYIVMELLSGKSLDDLVAEEAPLPEPLALRIAIEITEALKAAYTKGMIHGDVKPPNIIITDSSGAKLLDFGLAKLANVEVSQNAESIWGSPYYVSPERVGRKAEDFRSDIYSLGATIFEVLTGRPPFIGDNNDELAIKRLHEKPPLLRALNPKISKKTEQIIDRMLQKSPIQRYLDYDSLLSDLRKAESVILGKAAHRETGELLRMTRQLPPQPEPKSNTALIVIASVAAGLAAAAVIFLALGHKSEPPIASAPTMPFVISNPESPSPTPTPAPATSPAPTQPPSHAVFTTSPFTYKNPIPVANGIRDPRILLIDNTYYMTGTSAPYTHEGSNGVHLWTSKDLLNWKDTGLIIGPSSDHWYKTLFLSPGIFPYKGKFYLTFACGGVPNLNGVGEHSAIALAVADKITGPYQVISQDHPFADGGYCSLFMDDDGQVYLFTNIRSVPVDLEKGLVTGTPRLNFSADDNQPSWEGSFEDFSVFKRNGIYYLFTHLWVRGVEVGYATASSIMGPWKKYPQNPIFGAQYKPRATRTAWSTPSLPTFLSSRRGMAFHSSVRMVDSGFPAMVLPPPEATPA